jgi:hypothetical protein
LLDLREDAPHGVGEPVATLEVEPLDGFDQADVALLDQVIQLHPEPRYLTATETTRRRFFSISVRRASRSPARTLRPSSISSPCVRRLHLDMGVRYADNGSGAARFPPET